MVCFTIVYVYHAMCLYKSLRKALSRDVSDKIYMQLHDQILTLIVYFTIINCVNQGIVSLQSLLTEVG